MNAAVRAVTRCAIARGWAVVGVRQGFTGLIDADFVPLDARAVGGIMQQGGTVLGTARCERFKAADGQAAALASLRSNAVDALVVIGGNGSQAGASALAAGGFPVAGVPSTIDNDLAGSDVTIGVDTALNTALEAIDRIKSTASSHRRAFVVEVMGRNCGYLALVAGIAGGAEVIVIPEIETTADEIVRRLREAYERGKRHAIAVVAEGAPQNATALADYVRRSHAETGFELRTTILGHLQRGGVPTAADRLLATRLGEAAIAALADGGPPGLVGTAHGQIQTTPFAALASLHKPLDPALLALATVLER